jgi:hypothetical protein
VTNVTLARRDLVKAGLATGAVGMLPAAISDAQPAAIPRDRTLVLIKNGGRDGRWIDHELWNLQPA